MDRQRLQDFEDHQAELKELVRQQFHRKVFEEWRDSWTEEALWEWAQDLKEANELSPEDTIDACEEALNNLDDCRELQRELERTQFAERNLRFLVERRVLPFLPPSNCEACGGSLRRESYGFGTEEVEGRLRFFCRKCAQPPENYDWYMYDGVAIIRIERRPK